MDLRRPTRSTFDPNGAGDPDAGIFGLGFSADESSVVLLGVPWEATTSYGRGTAQGPDAIAQASPQLDLFELDLLELGLARPWRYGIHMLPTDAEVVARNQRACELAQPVIAAGGKIGGDPKLQAALDEVNAASHWLNARVYAQVKALLLAGHGVGLVGGDHSVPLGSIAAHAECYPGLGILHIDAHADLRQAYEGFTYSHASIMDNVLREVDGVAKIVQVGIRDFCEEEYATIRQNPKMHTYFDNALARRQHQGANWQALCDEIVGHLPPQVYVSFDIDGLQPTFCPHTGTPVPGGLSFAQAITLLLTLVQSGRHVVGFDLDEVAPGPNGEEWDGNVGARILYKLCALLLYSAGARDF